MVTPNTIVKLYSGIPFDPTYQNVLQWDSVTEQNQFFANQVPVATYTDFQFIDGTRELRIKRQMENCYHINYVAYQNHRYGNKWFYAFVTDMRYLSPESTALILEEDVWASWQFDLTFNKSFVERETVSNDAIGAHTLDEGLETGDYVTTAHSYTLFKPEDMRVIIAMTGIPDYIKQELGEGVVAQIQAPSIVRGIAFPVYWIECGRANNASSMVAAQAIIDAYTKAAQLDAIVGVFTVTKVGDNYSTIESLGAYPARTLSIVPRNNKLYCYPYCALNIISSSGDAKTFRYERMGTGGATGFFKITHPFGMRPTLSATMENYAGNNIDIQDQVSLSGFPVLPWVNNGYQDWLAKHKYTMATEFGAGLSTLAIGGLTGNPLAIAGGITATLGSLSKVAQAEHLPNNLNGTIESSDANAISGKSGFYANCVSIRAEYARIIDNFFSQYGYKVSILKNIELHNRQNWDFVQTIGCNVIGECPANVIETVKKMFDAGVTLWHNGTFNYGTLDNPIITTS